MLNKHIKDECILNSLHAPRHELLTPFVALNIYSALGNFNPKGLIVSRNDAMFSKGWQIFFSSLSNFL